MKKRLSIAMLILAMLIGVGAAQAVLNPEKGAESPDFTPTEGATAIPDDAYDGTLASMACVTVPGAAGLVEGATVDLAVNHSWIGDLTVKVQSPAGTTTTLQSRAGYAEPADDGTGCCGDSSDLIDTSPLNYDNLATDSAEDMGATILGGAFACQDDAICSYLPAPDTGPGVDLDDFNGENGAGDWLVCVGDSAGGDTGEITDAVVNLTVTPIPSLIEIPTLGGFGIAALLGLLGLGGVTLMRRRKS